MSQQQKFQQIYNTPDQGAKEEKINQLVSEEKKQYLAWANKQTPQFKEQRKKQKKNKKLAGIIVFVIILLVTNVGLYLQQKANISNMVIDIFKQHACQHGIQVDNQWFRTADELTDYVMKHHTKFHFYVVYSTIESDEFQYYYHENGL